MSSPYLQVPVLAMTSLLFVTTKALPAIYLSISPTPIRRTPGFLSKEIKQQASKASKVAESSFFEHNFLMNRAIVLQTFEALWP